MINDKPKRHTNQEDHEKMMDELLLDMPIGTKWIYIPDDELEDED